MAARIEHGQSRASMPLRCEGTTAAEARDIAFQKGLLRLTFRRCVRSGGL